MEKCHVISKYSLSVSTCGPKKRKELSVIHTGYLSARWHLSGMWTREGAPDREVREMIVTMKSGPFTTRTTRTIILQEAGLDNPNLGCRHSIPMTHPFSSVPTAGFMWPCIPSFHSAGICWGTPPCAKDCSGSILVHKAYSSASFESFLFPKHSPLFPRWKLNGGTHTHDLPLATET